MPCMGKYLLMFIVEQNLVGIDAVVAVNFDLGMPNVEILSKTPFLTAGV